MISFAQKIVLITGASGGFGREMTRQLLQAGAYLVLTDYASELLHTAVSEIAVQIGPVTGRILGFVQADLATEAGCEALYRAVKAITPEVDVLINNAGIAVSGPFTTIPRPAWERLMAINLLAPMRLIGHFGPDMIARRGGHIVNVSSAAGLVGAPGLAAYCAAKWGLRGFGEALGHELAAHGVRVTTLYPWFARTPILDSPQFGPSRAALPERLLYDPAFVIAALLRGMQNGNEHVYPGMIPKALLQAQRLVPSLVARIIRPHQA